jgi:hypothetical protein
MTDVDAIGGIVIVPLIVGLVQVARQAGLPVRWAALLALVIGLAVGATWTVAISPTPTLMDWLVGVLRGITWGLAASGLYSGARAMIPGGHTAEARRDA